MRAAGRARGGCSPDSGHPRGPLFLEHFYFLHFYFLRWRVFVLCLFLSVYFNVRREARAGGRAGGGTRLPELGVPVHDNVAVPEELEREHAAREHLQTSKQASRHTVVIGRELCAQASGSNVRERVRGRECERGSRLRAVRAETLNPKP